MRAVYFSLFLLVVSCSLGPEEPETGTIRIEVLTTRTDVTWQLVGPDTNYMGANEELLSSLPLGEYSVTWGHVDGFITPKEATRTLTAHATVLFSGVYVGEDFPSTPEGYVLVPAGTYSMGTSSDDFGSPNERPEHSVSLLENTYIQAVEVSNQQYLEIAQWAYDNGYCTASKNSIRDALDGSTVVLCRLNDDESEIRFNEDTEQFVHTNCGHGQNPDHPVKMVTWYGAAAYCDWLSIRDELPRAYNHTTWQCNGVDPYSATGYRLPTEAEWEYACRAGSVMDYANGRRIGFYSCGDHVLDEIGWYCGNSGYWTHAGGGLSPNAWEIYDMHGNLFEWCNDYWQSDYYAESPNINPTGPIEGFERVIRGGFWGSPNVPCRSAYRHWMDPNEGAAHIGFRPIRTVLIVP